jgi:hypothetical protein
MYLGGGRGDRCLPQPPLPTRCRGGPWCPPWISGAHAGAPLRGYVGVGKETGSTDILPVPGGAGKRRASRLWEAYTPELLGWKMECWEQRGLKAPIAASGGGHGPPYKKFFRIVAHEPLVHP